MEQFLLVSFDDRGRKMASGVCVCVGGGGGGGVNGGQKESLGT